MTGSSDGRAISWTTFNKPKTLIQNANAHYASTRSLSFAYGAEHQRIRQISISDTAANDLSDVTETTWYRGGLVQIDKPGGVTELHQQIAVPGASVLVVRHDKADGTVKGESTSYLHQDHLGSTSVITGRDSAGNVVVLERQYYDAFGLPLKGNDDARTAATAKSDITQQGYTGHETLTAFGLIQMNARLYDPVLGRFISADTFVQSPLNLQSYNRYSYVWNNPLSFTDPTGHFLSSKQRHWFKKNRNQILTTAVTIAFMPAGAIPAGAIGGAFGATINGGSGQDIFIAAFRGGVTAAISQNIFNGIGDAYGDGINGTINIYEKVIYHGVAGGYLNVMQGGSFQAGFIAATVTASANASGFTNFVARDTYAGNVVASALIGGTVSEINGGTFANGAITAAFQTMFNDLVPEHTPNRTGIPITPEEKAFLDQETKDGVIKFYESRLARGDAYAALALNVVKGEGSLGRLANAQLALEVMVNNNGTLPNYHEFMERVNIGLAKAHAKYVTSDYKGDTKGTPGLLSKYQVQEYHEFYFESINLSKHTFGGATFGGNNNWLFKWCAGCDAY